MGLFTIDRTINFDEVKVKKVLSIIRDSNNDEEIENKMVSSSVVSLRDNTAPHGFFRRRWCTFLKEFGVYDGEKISEIGDLYLDDYLITREVILLNLIKRYAIAEKSEKNIRPLESLIKISERLFQENQSTIISEEELKYICENLVDNSKENISNVVTSIISSRQGLKTFNLREKSPVHYDIWKNLLKTAGISNNNQIEIDVNLPIVRYISNYYEHFIEIEYNEFNFNDKFIESIPLPKKCDLNKPILYKRKNYEDSYSTIIYKYLFEKSINDIEIEDLGAHENGNIPYKILNGFNISTSRKDNPSNMKLYNSFIGYEGIIINKLRKTNDTVYSFIASSIKNYIDDNFNEVEDNMNDLKSFYNENLINNDYIESMIKQRDRFILDYPISRLLKLTKEEYCLGLEGYKNSLCNKLEKGEYARTGFSIGGANASKFGIYFKKDGKFHGKNDVLIENPNEYWNNYKQQLYDFIVEMGSNEPNFEIDKKYPLLGGPGGYMYLTKLLCLYYPDRFTSMSKTEAYDKLNEYLKIPSRENAIQNAYYSNIAFREYAPEANNHPGFYISDAVWKYFKMDVKEEKAAEKSEIIDDSKRAVNAYNKIYYGIPGCGKSWIANKFALEKSKDDKLIVRTTFYPDYTNSDFVGQIIPKIDENDINNVLYDIQSGPFTEAMVKAIDNPNKYICLIVEEINRGNSAAIFGDLFQLLDRDENGTSEYWIKNYTITEYLKKHCLNKAYDLEHIRIPSNLYIIGTMNTSDQNVFTLDTAFKRRWTMEHIPNDVKNSKYKDEIVPSLNIKWCDFVEKINELITINSEELGINGEDKQIGSYFVSSVEWNRIDNLVNTNNKKEAAKVFAEKVLSYLWEDVAKIGKDIIFEKDYYTFDKVVEDFMQEKDVLKITDTEE